MSNVVLVKYFDRVKAAYETSAFTEGICPEMLSFVASLSLDYITRQIRICLVLGI